MRTSIAIIPARAGSKGIPGKNYRLIAGKPLVYWSLLAAHQSEVKTIALTTNCPHVKKIGEDFGAEFKCGNRLVIIDRPEELCTDDASTEDAMNHVLDQTGIDYGFVVLLQPTSPMRMKNLINHSIVTMCKEWCQSLLTVSPCTPFLFQKTSNNGSKSLWNVKNRVPRQHILQENMFFHDDGCLYVTKYAFFKQHKCRLDDHPYLYVNSPCSSFQIDTEEDFIIASKIMEEIRATNKYV